MNWLDGKVEPGEDPLFAGHADALSKNLSPGVFNFIADLFSKFNRFSKYGQSINQATAGTEGGEIVNAAIRAANALSRLEGGHQIDLEQKGGAINFQSIAESTQRRKKS